MPEEEKKLWAIYTRRSKKDEKDSPEGTIQAQEHRCSEYLKRVDNKDVEYVVFCDDGITGKTTTKRKSFNEMVEMLKEGKIKGIIATELSRFNRNVIASNMLRNFCIENNIRIISISEGYDTTSHNGNVTFHLCSALAQIESERISDRVHFNALDRAKRGLYTGNRIFGYQLGKQIKGHLEIDEDESKIVQLIFDKCCDGETCSQIAEYLNRCGFRNRGGKWVDSAILRILKNTVYIAQRTIGTEVISCVWKPIITQEQFQLANQRLAENYRNRRNPSGGKNHTYLLSGLLYCPVCNEKLETSSGTNSQGIQYFYYRHRNQNTPQCPLPKYIQAHELERLIIDRIFRLSQEENILQLIYKDVTSQYNQKVGEQTRAITRVQKLLDEIMNRATSILEGISIIPKEEQELLAKPKLAELLAQKKKLMEERDILEKNLEEIKKSEPTIDKIYQMIEDFTDLIVGSDIKSARKLLSYLVEKIEITRDAIVCYMYGQQKTNPTLGFAQFGCRRGVVSQHNINKKNIMRVVLKIPFVWKF